MKKSVIIGKRQFILAGLVLVLGLAVWANMRLAASEGGLDISAELTSSKYLGEAQLVGTQSVADTSSLAAPVSAQVENDLLSLTKTDRDKAREDEFERLEDTINSAKSKGADVSAAAGQLAALTKRGEDERAIEQILAAKGFDAVVTIGDRDVTVMVDKGELISTQTMQIQDAVQATVEAESENIKIVTIK